MLLELLEPLPEEEPDPLDEPEPPVDWAEGLLEDALSPELPPLGAGAALEPSPAALLPSPDEEPSAPLPPCFDAPAPLLP